jgi:uncharacterized protein (DUF433 family)
MTISLHVDPVPLRVDERSIIYVGDSRVTLDVLIEYWRSGLRPEEIARGLNTLSLADILGALAYYHRHRAEIDAYLSAGMRQSDVLRAEIEAATSPSLQPLRNRIKSMTS